MAGLAPISLQQRVDRNGRPYVGAKAYFFSAATLTALTVYQDYTLSVPHANPVEADETGTFPAVFLDEGDGFYRLRVATASGQTLSDLQTLPVIGPTDGGGGAEVPVDPNALWKTGDIKARYGVGAHPGWVRLNARTIGSASSGATERANADTEALFTHLYNEDTALAVSGGRGANAAADWAANKTIALPDWRGRSIIGMGDMGNTATTVLTTDGFGNSPLVLGNPGGNQVVTLTESHLPVISRATTGGSVTGSVTMRAGNVNVDVGASATVTGGSPTPVGLDLNFTHPNFAFGGGSFHSVVSPSRTATIYMKL